MTLTVLEPRGYNSPLVRDAMDLVQSIPGPVEFRHLEWTMPEPVIAFEDESESRKKKVPKRKELGEAFGWVAENRSEWEPKKLSFPKAELSHDYESMEDLRLRLATVARDFFESTGADPHNNLAVMLTNVNNTNNYFAVPDLFHLGCAMIQVNHYVTTVTVAPHLPISYEILAMGLRRLAFPSYDDFMPYLHLATLGCMNDFCKDVIDMERKIRMADLCSDCLSQVEKSQVPFGYLRQVQEGFEKIRKFQLNINNLLHRFEQIRLEIGHQFRVGNTGISIPFSPKEKAVYALLIENPGGIAISQFPDKTERLSFWYRRFNTRDIENFNPEATVKRLVFNEDGDLSQTIAKINQKLRKALLNLGQIEQFIVVGGNTQPKYVTGAGMGLVTFSEQIKR